MRNIFCLIVAVLIGSGCQTIFLNSESVPKIVDISSVKGAKSHLIELEVDENLKSMLKKISFYNITERGNKYLLVAGSIQKQMGASSIERKKINIRFVDEQGNIVEEGTDKISIEHLRKPIGSRGRFSIKVPYLLQIKKCVIAFEVKSK